MRKTFFSALAVVIMMGCEPTLVQVEDAPVPEEELLAIMGTTTSDPHGTARRINRILGYPELRYRLYVIGTFSPHDPGMVAADGGHSPDPRCEFSDGATGAEVIAYAACITAARLDETCNDYMEPQFEENEDGTTDVVGIHIHCAEDEEDEEDEGIGG